MPAKIKSSVTDYARDAVAMAFNGFLTYSIPLIGGLIGTILGNYIAAPGHKTAVNVVNVLMYVDSLAELVRGGRGVI